MGSRATFVLFPLCKMPECLCLEEVDSVVSCGKKKIARVAIYTLNSKLGKNSASSLVQLQTPPQKEIIFGREDFPLHPQIWKWSPPLRRRETIPCKGETYPLLQPSCPGQHTKSLIRNAFPWQPDQAPAQTYRWPSSRYSRNLLTLTTARGDSCHHPVYYFCSAICLPFKTGRKKHWLKEYIRPQNNSFDYLLPKSLEITLQPSQDGP